MANLIYISPDDLLTKLMKGVPDDLTEACALLQKAYGNMQTPSTVPCGEKWFVFGSNEQNAVHSCLSQLRNLSDTSEDLSAAVAAAPQKFLDADKSFKGTLSGSLWQRLLDATNIDEKLSSPIVLGELIASLFFSGSFIQPVHGWITDVTMAAVDSYNEKGGVYKAWQYGKATFKIAVGVGKEVKAFGEIVTLDPSGILNAVSGAGDIANGIDDWIFLSYGCYDLVGSTNAVKDDLILAGSKIGGHYGNEETGALYGEAVYDIYEVIDLCNGTVDMIDSIGDAHVVLTGKSGYSSVWGETSFDNVLDKTYNFSPEPEYIIKKILNIDASSDFNVLYESAKNIYSTIKDSVDFGKDLSDLISSTQDIAK